MDKQYVFVLHLRFLLILLFVTTKSSILLFVSSSSIPPPISVVRNLARGSTLKCLADLCGGLPFEVWKSNVVLESIRSSQQQQLDNHKKRVSDTEILARVIQEKGIQGLWSGWQARMVEGFFSGAVLLAVKETVRKAAMSSPIITKAKIPPTLIGFAAGAIGGASQSVVMAPCSLLVTATATAGTTGSNNKQSSVLSTFRMVWAREGVRGIYRGAPAIAARQATNWASRQGFAELVRPHIGISGIPGEIIAGMLSGTISTWNTPFEVARITAQSKVFVDSDDSRRRNNESKSNRDDSHHHTFLETMNEIVKTRGVGGLYTGIIPRIGQSCYQTIFLVSIPRLIGS